MVGNVINGLKSTVHFSLGDHARFACKQIRMAFPNLFLDCNHSGEHPEVFVNHTFRKRDSTIINGKILLNHVFKLEFDRVSTFFEPNSLFARQFQKSRNHAFLVESIKVQNKNDALAQYICEQKLHRLQLA